MTQYKETIVNAQTGEVTVRDLTDAEIADLQSQQAELEERLAIQQAEAEAKATARQAVLDRLGLSAEEAALLLG